MKGYTMLNGNIDPIAWLLAFILVGWILFGCGCATVQSQDQRTRSHATFKMRSCKHRDILLFYRCQAEVMDFCRENGLEKNCWEAN